MGTRCADHATPLYPQKLALNSPTGGGRSVDIVRSRTKATEFVLFVCLVLSDVSDIFVELNHSITAKWKYPSCASIAFSERYEPNN